MKKKETSTLCIIGFILSIFTFITGFIICIIGSIKAKEEGKSGVVLATAGKLISILKIIAVIIAFILFSFHTDEINIEKKCKSLDNCTLNETGTYTCTFINDEGVEEYIECKKEEDTQTQETTEEDYEDMDTTDYDIEN